MILNTPDEYIVLHMYYTKPYSPAKGSFTCILCSWCLAFLLANGLESFAQCEEIEHLFYIPFSTSEEIRVPNDFKVN